MAADRASPRRPLPALLSQALVAFTIEFDNEFERRMGAAGHRGALLSFAIWANLMRFLGEDGVTVRSVAEAALIPEKWIKVQLGCLERWGFVALQQREGWGSARGIRASGTVSLTPRGLAACKIWAQVLTSTERRWETRFGQEEFGRLRNALREIAENIPVELPHGLPGGWEGMAKFPPRVTEPRDLPFPTLLSWLLLAFRIEFGRESPAPLELCANTLRILSDQPLPEAQIPHLTGCSPETSGLGWQIKPYVIVEPDPKAKRGKLVRLSPQGLDAQKTYQRLTDEIQERWKAKLGEQKIAHLRESLDGLFDAETASGSRLAEGLVPAPGTVRAGHRTPALGRQDVGPAAQKRARDLVAQTKAFISDPAGRLPHYPLWDMNRGFGP
jgi:hypothetical protein